MVDIDFKKVEEYANNLEILPPIIINQDKILIDGWHRIKAHIKAGKTEFDKEPIIKKTKSDEDLYLMAIELNATHGLQLSYKDKQSIAVNFTKKALERKEDITDTHNRIVKALSISNDTYNKWTKDIRKSYDEEIKKQIIQEYLKAEFTQQQVAEKFGVSDSLIRKILEETAQKINLLFVRNPEEFDKEMREFAEDNQELISFIKTREDGGRRWLFNLWYVSKITNSGRFGNFPIEYLENLLYYYTEPFDIVYDPFGGSGVTIDACRQWFRRYYVSDAFPIEIRKEDIKKWKIQDVLEGKTKDKGGLER